VDDRHRSNSAGITQAATRSALVANVMPADGAHADSPEDRIAERVQASKDEVVNLDGQGRR
jgi:hypothetical protein